MQRLTQQCLGTSLALPSVLCDLMRRLTCPSSRSLHSSVGPHKQHPVPLDADDDPMDAEDLAAASGSDADEATSGSDDEASTSAAAAAAEAASAADSTRRRYLGLDDPVFNFSLNYNLDFTTDPNRWYTIGQINAEDQKNRLELRKALAAHRLQLKDAAAAAGDRKQPGMQQQMNSRLMDMQTYLSTPFRQ